MQKKLAILFASTLLLSAANTFAFDDDLPANGRVPDAGSSALLIGCALTGVAGLRYFLRKKD